MDGATGTQTSQRPSQTQPVFARREFFGLGAAALGGSLLIAACGSSGSAGSGSTNNVSLTMFIWAQAQALEPRKVVAGFEQVNPGDKVSFIEGTNATTFPQLVASVQVNPNKPLLNLGFFNAQSFAQGESMWSPVTTAEIPNLANVLPKYSNSSGLGAYMCMDALGLVYNKKVVPTPPTSWMDLFSPAYKGKVSVWDAPAFSTNALPVIAVLNGGSASNLDPGIKLYSQAAKNGQFLDLLTSLSQLQQQLNTGQTALTPGFQGIVEPWLEANANLGFVVPKEGVMAMPEGLQVVKGSSSAQIDVARKIMNAMFDPAAVSGYCADTATIPLVTGAQVPAKFRDRPSFQLSTVQSAIQIDWSGVAAVTDKYTTIWNNQVKANL
jgi:putative spermidine/putrescine transport system substrate-binding protein